MPIERAFLYALGLCAAFGGPSAAIGMAGGYSPGAIWLILFGWLAIGTLILSQPYFTDPENGDRLTSALRVTIIFRFFAILMPCLFVDIFCGAIATGLADPTASEYRFGRSLAIGAMQSLLSFGQFGVVFLIAYRLVHRKPGNPNLCHQCGYDIRASREFGRCPECGTLIPVRQVNIP